MSIKQQHLQGAAAHIAQTKALITIGLHEAIVALNRPGAMMHATADAGTLLASAFGDLATLYVSQTAQQELLLAHMNGDGLETVREKMRDNLVDFARGAPNAVDVDGEPVGPLARAFNEHVIDSFAQNIDTLETELRDEEHPTINCTPFEKIIEHLLGGDAEEIRPGVYMKKAAVDADLANETGNLPPEAFERRVPRFERPQHA